MRRLSALRIDCHWRQSLWSGLALLGMAIFSLAWPGVVHADVVIGGCTIVSNPTATHFTNCPNANLNGKDLSGVVDLSFANFSGASLQGANVADLVVDDVNFSNANLTNADLSGDSLNRANFTNANLTGVNLDNADLSKANLTGVIWSNTQCPDATNSNSHGNTCLGHLLLPSITATATQANGLAYAPGVWTTQNVTVHFVCTAAGGHKIETCPADQSYTTEGSFTANGTATDTDGFFSELSFGPIQIDRTAPSLSVSAAKADSTPYAAATWSNQNVTLHYTCSDSNAGLAGACPADQIISIEGVTAPVNQTILDKAGNSASVSFGPIQLDKTKPTISGSRTPAANSNGWNVSDVTVSFTCADNPNGSGLATNTVAGATVSSEGAKQSVTNSGVCVDNAGNSAATATLGAINIDKSAPETKLTRQPENPSPLVATFEFSGTDALSGIASFLCSLDSAPATACVSPQTYSTLAAGQHTFQAQAVDGVGLMDATAATYTWAADGNLPVANEQTVTTAEEQAIAITLQGSGKHALTYIVVSTPSHGVLSGAPPLLTYTPTLNFNGSDSFTFRVNDGQLASNLAKVVINVTPVNDPPLIEQTNVTLTENAPVSITLHVQDVDGDQLTFAVLRQPLHGVLTGALPTVAYTPAVNFNGQDSFVFSVNDGAPSTGQNRLTSVLTGTVQITVVGANDAPVANGQTVITPPGQPVSVLLMATDPEGDPLTYTLVALPQHGAISGVAPNLTYTPVANFTGNDILIFQASDGRLTSARAPILIRVTNQPVELFLPLVKR